MNNSKLLTASDIISLIKEVKTSFIATTILSVAFFLIFLPIVPLQIEPQIYNFVISFAFGYGMFIAIVLLYCLSYLITRFISPAGTIIKYGKVTKLSIWLLGMGIGSCFGMAIKARIIGVPLTLDSIWVSLLFGGLIALMFHFYYSNKESGQKNLELQMKNAETELHVLKNQMQPHFLFNSLNSLLYLIESKNEQAPEMTMLLSDLYREILEVSQNPLIRLKNEISIVEKYLKLEQLRYGERLRYSLKIPDDYQEILVPPLVLQTLVENAIKHGISQSPEDGDIEIFIEETSNGYVFKVVNTGQLMSDKTKSGVGLSNTQSRLNLLYGTKSRFQIQNWQNKVLVSFWVSGVDLANS